MAGDQPVVRVLGECKVQLRFIFKGDAASRFLFEAADENCMTKDLASQGCLYAINVLNPEYSMISEAHSTSPPLSKDVLKEKYLEEGLSIQGLAKEFSSSKSKIRGLLSMYQIPIRESFRRYEENSLSYGKRKVKGQTVDYKVELRTMEAIRRMYVDEGLTPNGIARVLDAMKTPTKHRGKAWHHSSVIRILEKEGVYQAKYKRVSEMV